MELILSRLVPMLNRIYVFLDAFSVYIAAILICLTLFRIFVGFCLFRKMGKPWLLGAAPIIGELSLYAYLGIFIFVPVKALCLAAIALLDVFAYTAPADGSVYLLFMLPFLLLILIMRIAFSLRLSRAFNAEWYFLPAIFLLPIVFIPILTFGRHEYFGLN